MLELGGGRAGQRERRERSDELAGAMGEGLDTDGWQGEEDSAGSGGGRGDAYYNDSAANAIGLRLVGEGEVDSGEYEYAEPEECVYDEERVRSGR